MDMKWKLGIVLGLAVSAGLLVGVVGSARSDAEARPWKELPAPPLSPRELPAGFWTGEEVILVGGSDAPPCPPNASCAVPKTPPLSDGAAYDPEAGTWRSIADAPVPFSWAQAIVLGSIAYLWIPGESPRPQAPSAFLAYGIDDDRWEELAMPTKTPDAYSLVMAGEQIVAYSSGDEPRELPDLVFDPGSEDWSELPDDPLSAGFDRLVVRDGGELLLFDHELVPNPGGDGEPVPLRGAAFELGSGEWRILEDPDAAYVRSVPAWGDSLAGILDESGARYFRRAGEVRDEIAGTTLRMPELAAVVEAYGGTTDVTAGRDLFVFLGSSWGDGGEEGEFFGELHSAAWLWSPRP
jgi:hypothetical protein